MDKLLDLSAGDFPAFLLTLVRISGLMMLAPVFGSQVIPPVLKALLSLGMAAIFFPVVDRPAGPLAPNLGLYLVAVGWELGVGVLIGFVSAMIFAAVQFGGQLIDQELGFLMANVVDPISNEQTSIVGQFKLFLSMVVYLLIDGHHFLLRTAVESFSAVPLLGLSFSDGLVVMVSDTVMTDLFRMAVQIAAPAMATLFMITVAMAFLARTVPEMNIFILGYTVRIVVGLLVLVVGVGLFVHGFRGMNLQHDEAVKGLLRLWGGR